MVDKPSYLGLLNAIAVGEARGHDLLDAWAQTTPCATLASDLRQISIREAEHAAAFRKRLSELGFQVRPTPAARFSEDLNCARSAATDLEKFRQLIDSDLNLAEQGEDDPLAGLFKDRSIDPETGALLGRFIAEERDTQRRLQSARQRLTAAQDGMKDTTDLPPGLTERMDSADRQEDVLLGEILTRLDRLGDTLENLKSLRPDDKTR